MAINNMNITEQNILDAMKYIDEHGTPQKNLSTKYDLVAGNGKKYSPKYVIAVASQLANGGEISTAGYDAGEAISFLKKLNFKIEEKSKQEIQALHKADNMTFTEELKKYSRMLLEAKNLIFRGAPGTGKSFLAKAIAAYIISEGQCDNYAGLTDEQKKQVEFVQFHPNYDYSDFVEGLRPCKNEDGTIGFDLQDGIFKRFVARARKNYEDSERKNYIFIIDEINRGEISKIFGELFFAIDPGYRGKSGEVSTQYANLHTDPDEKFYVPENVYIIGTMNDIDRSVDTFDFAMRRRFRFVEIKANDRLEMLSAIKQPAREDAILRMSELNKAIAEVNELGENYQIGAAYFLKLETLDSDELWLDYLEPLLREYVRGMDDEDGIMSKFAKAYGYPKQHGEDSDETAQN